MTKTKIISGKKTCSCANSKIGSGIGSVEVACISMTFTRLMTTDEIILGQMCIYMVNVLCLGQQLKTN